MNFYYSSILILLFILKIQPCSLFSQEKNAIGLSFNTTFEKVVLIAPRFSDNERRQSFTTGIQLSLAYKHENKNRIYVYGINYSDNNVLAVYNIQATNATKMDGKINYQQISFDFLISKRLGEDSNGISGKVGLGLQPSILMNTKLTGYWVNENTGVSYPLDNTNSPGYRYRKINIGTLFYLGIEYQLTNELSIELNSLARINVLPDYHPYLLKDVPRILTSIGIQLNKSL